MASFEGRGGDVVVALDEEEANLMRGLLTEMKELLTHEHEVQDDVVDRLFPAAYAEPEDAENFRALVGDDLSKGKQQAILSVLSVLGDEGPVDTRVPRSEIDAWLTALNDVRLALGTRFAVTEEKMSAELEPSDPESSGIAILHWLGWMQEMLIRAISSNQDDDRAAPR
jgi:hypothetical protein